MSKNTETQARMWKTELQMKSVTALCFVEEETFLLQFLLKTIAMSLKIMFISISHKLISHF